MDMIDRIRILYPVDPDKVSVEMTEEELKYEINKEDNVAKGIIHPKFVRYHKEDPNNPETRKDTQQMIYDYRTCKLCSRFNQDSKVCDELNKYIPIIIQFKGVVCPKNKWE